MTLEFSQNELPHHIDSPLKFVSVISKSPDLQPALNALLDHAYFQRCVTDSPLSIIDTLAKSAAKFYNVIVTSQSCKMVFSSLSPTHISTTLDENTFFQNSYIGRHITFKKIKPFKGSVDIETVFQTSLDRGHKYYKDFEFLCSTVFAGSEVTVICDVDVSTLSGASFTNLHEHLSFQSHRLTTPLVENSGSKQLEALDSDDKQDLYEFLSLVHLNALPDMSNSHVAVTSRYSLPDLDALSDIFSSEIFSYTISHTNPLILYELASMPEVVSVQAVSETHNYLLLKLENLYVWSAQFRK